MEIETDELSQLPFFVGLTSRELEAAARALSPVEVAQGEVIFAQGEDGGWIYVLARGEADISIEMPASLSASSQAPSAVGEASEPTGRRVLAALRAPALLGEMSVLLDEPRSAWAVATAPCLLWQVSREEVRHALEANQKWALRLLLAMSKVLAARLSDMNRQIVELASHPARGLDNHDLAVLQQLLFKYNQARHD